MARFSFFTQLRPPTTIDDVPVSFAGEVVTAGVILKDGVFSYELLDSDLMALIHTKKAQVVVGEIDGSYSAEICLII